MKSLFCIIALIWAQVMALHAQELLLPISSSSETAKAAYIEGLQAAENADIPSFVGGMKAAVKADPGFFMAHAYLALAGTFFQEDEPAAAAIETALAIDPAGFNQGEQILREALQALAEDSEADLAPFMASLTAAYPQTAQAHELAATSAYWISEDSKAAAQHLVHLLELRPAYGGGYNMLGYNYMALGEMDQAKAAFEKYLELAPDEDNAYDSMGEYYMVTKDYAKSVEYYDRAVAMGMEAAKERAEKAREAMAKDWDWLDPFSLIAWIAASEKLCPMYEQIKAGEMRRRMVRVE